MGRILRRSRITLWRTCVHACRLAGRAAEVLNLPEEEVDWKEERRLWKEEELIAQVRLQKCVRGCSHVLSVSE